MRHFFTLFAMLSICWMMTTVDGFAFTVRSWNPVTSRSSICLNAAKRYYGISKPATAKNNQVARTITTVTSTTVAFPTKLIGMAIAILKIMQKITASLIGSFAKVCPHTLTSKNPISRYPPIYPTIFTPLPFSPSCVTLPLNHYRTTDCAR